MVFLVVCLGLLLALALVGLGMAISKYSKMYVELEQHAENVEACLDTIDEVYQNISKVLNSPLASNDPGVKLIHNEIKRAHGSLLLVAHRLTSGWQDDEEGTKTSDRQSK